MNRLNDDQNKMLDIFLGKSPILATAIHNGHRLRSEVAEIINLDDATRLREEDPFTGEWTAIAKNRITGLYSRFEVDLNRPRDRAIYIKPDDAWGLKVWKTEPSPRLINTSLGKYDSFYLEIQQILADLVKKFKLVIVLDLHSYNYLREGPDGPPADPELNPEVNIGTGSVNRDLWGNLVDRFISDLRRYRYFDRNLDVRENVKFKGGYFSQWIHQTFPKNVCALAIEFKKFFMDEWTGKPDQKQLKEIGNALQSTISGLLAEIDIMLKK